MAAVTRLRALADVSWQHARERCLPGTVQSSPSGYPGRRRRAGAAQGPAAWWRIRSRGDVEKNTWSHALFQKRQRSNP